ncbi:MAG: hypothetical protein EOO36_15260 [Cytophagaceae bacterium]|nr:MAG: hypothetical protein EOO36_15260 [Cytophagaceae bacterium]
MGTAGLLAGPSAAAQTSATDTTRLVAANGLRQQYAHALRDTYGLYSGPAYTNYVRPGTVGHRFFATPDEQPATIVYGGQTYAGVPARYDLVRDQLVLTAQSRTSELRLVSERVARFTLGGHTFVHLSAASVAGSPLRPGFYDLLVAGPVAVLASRRKKYDERTENSLIVSEILDRRTDYFIRQGGRYYEVSKAGDVLRLFPKQRAVLREYAQTHNLQFDEAGREAALVELVRYQATL